MLAVHRCHVCFLASTEYHQQAIDLFAHLTKGRYLFSEFGPQKCVHKTHSLLHKCKHRVNSVSVRRHFAQYILLLALHRFTCIDELINE